MLHLITHFTDKFFNFLAEDPVRPSIPHLDRIGDNRDIFVFRGEDETVKAITCVSYRSVVPSREGDLFTECTNPSIAVFYTIWSYKPGAGRQLIFDSVKHIKESNPNIDRFVTLSQKTEMARRFHLKNGAKIFKENDETVNYEYISL